MGRHAVKVELPALSGSAVFALAGVAVLGLVLWKAATSWAPAATQAIADAAEAVNPLNHDNVIATTVNKVLGGGDPSWTLGGAIYDATHPDPVAPPAPPINQANGVIYDAFGNVIGTYDEPPANTGGATGSW
jgi:hypothetical protein